MINMLPTDMKESILYARRNTYLRKWLVALCIALFGVAAITGAGYIYLQNSINNYAREVKLGNETLKTQKLDETQKNIQDLSNSLKLVTQVLQREILFSKLLSQIGSALPNGSVLTSLSINKTQGGIDLQAGATDYQTGTQVQLNLQDPKNKIFEKADIVSIQCETIKAGTDPVKAQYPCTVQLRALFAKNNAFTFITSASGSNKQ